LLKRQL